MGEDVWSLSYRLPLASGRHRFRLAPLADSLFGRLKKRGDLDVSGESERVFYLPLSDVHGVSKSSFTCVRQPLFTGAGQSCLT